MNRPQPLTGLAAVFAAARTTTAGAPRGRRLLGLLFLIGTPLVIQILLLIFQEGGRGQGFTTFANLTNFYLRLLAPLAVIFLGTSAFGEEWAGGTAHYVMGLPVSRSALVVGRWLMVGKRALTMILPALLAIYLLATLPLGVFGDYVTSLLWVLVVVSVLVMAYASIFLLFGLGLKRAMITSLVYVFAIEGLTARLPQSLAQLSLAYHARNVMGQLTGASAGADHFALRTTDVGAVAPPSISSSLFVLGGVTLVALSLATLVLWRKESGGEVQAGDAAGT